MSFKKLFYSVGIESSSDIWLLTLSVFVLIAYGASFGISFIPGEKIQENKEEIVKYGTVPIIVFTGLFFLYFLAAKRFVLGGSVDTSSKWGMIFSGILLCLCVIIFVIPEETWKEEKHFRESMVGIQLFLFFVNIVLLGWVMNNRTTFQQKYRQSSQRFDSGLKSLFSSKRR